MRNVVGNDIRIVDSASTTATVVDELLGRLSLRAEPGNPATLRLLATDGVRRFARVGGMFLGQPLAATDVELTDL